MEQGKLDVGKAARSSKLWFLLKQSMSKFQRAQDLIRLIEIQRGEQVQGMSSGGCSTRSFQFARELRDKR